MNESVAPRGTGTEPVSVGQPAGRETGQRATQSLGWSIYAYLLAILLGFSVVISGALIWFSSNQISRIMLGISEIAMRQMSADAAQRAEALLGSIRDLASRTALLPAAGYRPNSTAHPLRPYFIEVLESNPRISSMFIGGADGSFYQVYNNDFLGDAARESLAAPAETRFVVRYLARTKDGATETWGFLDHSGLPLGPEASRPSVYDPRDRPWYRGALDRTDVLVTDSYAFATIKEVGITAAQRIPGAAGSVFGVDLTLSSLSDYLVDWRLPETAIWLAFDRRMRVFAYPGVASLVDDTENVQRQIQVSDLGQPAANWLAAKAAKLGGRLPPLLRRSIDGEDYLGLVTPLRGGPAPDLFLAIAVPEQALLSSIRAVGVQSLLVSLAIVGLVVPLIVLASMRIAEPIKALAVLAYRMRDLDLDGAVPHASRVREVRRLAEAMAAMRAAVGTFCLYLPKTLVKRLVATGETPELGGESRDVTVLFSDIERFTDLAATMSARDLMRKISSYLEAITRPILAENGTVDKFIGDSVMALWNAATDEPRHVHRACVAALGCRRANRDLNAAWASFGWPPLHTRYGLHVGDTAVGHIGCSDRMEFTAIGNAVNVASRLQGANKFYGTEILVSGDVRDAAGEAFLFRPVDVVELKGVETPIPIYALLGAFDGDLAIRAEPDQCRLVEAWNEVHAAYRARDWQCVADGLEAFRREFPADPVAAVYGERVSRFLACPPAADWNGVIVLDSK